ncbi:hypothetical protein ABPG74_017489 [Tetrahymena malaccensis]
MQFSNIIQGACSAIFSQDSSLIAISNGSKILVKYFDSYSFFTINQLIIFSKNNKIKDINQELINRNVYSFQDIITHMEFSPDNQLILVVQSNSSTVEVKNFNDEQWICKIVDQACGLLHAVWAPDSRSIITFSDFQVFIILKALQITEKYQNIFQMKATIYSLADKQQYLIKNPKYPDRGLSFSSDGKFMALAERRDIKDYIGIYYTKDWKLVNHFQVDTMDLVDIQWSKDDGSILVWDSSINYKFLVYHPSNGLIQRIQPYEYALGIKCVELSNTPNFIAIGSYDEKIRLLNTLTWKVITELEHKANIKEYSNAIVYREQNSTLLNAQHLVDRTTTQFVIDESINKLPGAKQTTDKSQQSGVTDVTFSFNANYIASKSASFPNAVFIWEVSLLELRYIILLQNPVKGFLWSHNSNNLIIYAGSNKIYFWSLDGASVCELPQYGKQFSVNKVLWNKNSKCLVLIDRRDAIIGYPPIDLEYNEEHEEEQREEYEN